MEKRKVQKIGGGSYSLTLPKEWVKKNGVSRDVEITHRGDGALTVYGPRSGMQFTRIVEIAEKSRAEIFSEIISLYELGADEVDILGPANANVRRSIHEALRFVIGFQIISERPDKIIIKSVLNPKGISFAQCLQSMTINARSMMEDATEAFLTNDKDLAEEVIKSDVEVDKLYHLVIRGHQSLLQDKPSEEHPHTPLIESHAYQYLATQMERTADRMVKIANFIVRNEPTTIDTNFKSLARKLSNSFQKILLASVQEGLEKKEILQLFEENKEIKGEADAAKAKAIRNSSWGGFMFLDNMKRVPAYVENILEKQYQRALLARDASPRKANKKS